MKSLNQGVQLAVRQLLLDLEEGTKEYYPLNRIHIDDPMGALSLQNQENRRVSSLILDQIEQLTDMFFYTLCHKVQPEYLEMLERVSCVGCIHLTDAAIHWLIQAVIKANAPLRKVSLPGCNKISSASLHKLKHEYLEYSGTSLEIDMRLCNVESTITAGNLNDSNSLATGCPCALTTTQDVRVKSTDETIQAEEHRFLGFFNPYDFSSPTVSELKGTEGRTLVDRTIYKVVIPQMHNAQWNLVDALKGQVKIKTGEQKAASVLMNLSNTNGKNGKQKKVCTYNLVECNEYLLQVFLCEGCIVLLPLQQEAEYSPEAWAKEAVDIIIRVLQQVDNDVVQFAIAAFGKKEFASAYEKQLEKELEAVVQRLQEDVSYLMSNLKQLDFPGQQNARQLCILLDRVNALCARQTSGEADPRGPIKLITPNYEQKDGCISVDKESFHSLLEESSTGADAAVPWLSKLTPRFLAFQAAVEIKPDICAVDDVIPEILNKLDFQDLYIREKPRQKNPYDAFADSDDSDDSDEESIFHEDTGEVPEDNKEAKFESPTYYSALKIMHGMGVIVYMPSLKSQTVVTDVGKFVDLYNEIILAGKPAGSSSMKFLDRGVSVLSENELESLIAKVGMKNTKVSHVSNMMHDLGLACLNEKQMVLYSSLSTSPFIQENPEEDTGEEVSFTYHLPCLVTGALFSKVQHSILNIVASWLDVEQLWDKGLLIHEGLVDINLSTDGQVLRLSGQMYKSGDSDSDSDDDEASLGLKFLWTTVEKYKVAVDYTLQQAHVYAKVNVTRGGTRPVDIVPVHHGHDTKSDVTEIDNTKYNPSCRSCGVPTDKIAALWGMYKDLHPTFIQEVGFTGQDDDPRKKKDRNELEFTDGNVFLGSSERCVSYSLDPYCFNQATITVLKDSTFQIALAFTSEEAEDFEKSVSVVAIDLGNGVLMQAKQGYNDDSDSDSDVPQDMSSIPTLRTCGVSRLVVRLDPTNKPGFLGFTLFVNDVKIRTGEVAGNMAFLLLQMSSASDPCCIVQLNKAPRIILSSDAGIAVGMRVEAWDKKTPRYVCAATVADIDPDVRQLKVHFDGWKGYDYWMDVSSTYLHPVGFMEKIGYKQKDKYVSHVQPPKFYGNEAGVFTWRPYLEETSSKPVPRTWFNKEQHEGMGAFIEDPPGCEKFAPSNGIKNLVPQRLDICSSHGFSAGAIMSSLRKMLNGMKLTGTAGGWTDLGSLMDDPSLCLLPAPQLTAQNLAHTGRHKLKNFQDHSVHFLCARHGHGVHLVDCSGVKLPKDVNIKHLIGPLFLGTACLYQAQNFMPMNSKKLLLDAGDFEKVQSQLHRLLELYLLSYCMMKEGPLEPNPGMSKYLKAWEWAPETKEELNKLWSTTASSDVRDVLKSVEDQQYFACQVHNDTFLENFSQGGQQHYFDSYAHLVQKLQCDSVKLTQQLPSDVWSTFNNITELLISNSALQELPEGLGQCNSLVKIDLKGNRLSSLPDDLEECKNTLTYLNVSDNPMDDIPKTVFKLEFLEELFANNICLRQLPDDIVNLKRLRTLDISGHMLCDLPKTFHQLTSLRILDISGVRWLVGYDQAKSILVQADFLEYTAKTNAFKHWTHEAIVELFSECDERHQGTLVFSQIQKLNAILFNKFSRFGSPAEDAKTGSTIRGLFPRNLFPPGEESLYEEDSNGLKVEHLVMSFHGFTSVPDRIKYLPLESLDLTHNPRLEVISGKVGLLPIKSLHLKGCPSLRTPPKEIVSRGFQAVKGYLHRLTMGSTTCTRTKLMLVGLGGAGKTSLIKSLMESGHQTEGTSMEEVTDGIDITDWEVTPNGKDFKITYSIWDFAGQTVYYNTHQFFLSNRAVYFLVWNVRLGHEHAGLDFWLNSIGCHAPKAPIFVVGTHVDQVEKAGLPAEEMAKRYPQISGFHYVSAFTGQGVDQLITDLTQVTLKEKYMGEEIPVAWLGLEKKIKEKAKETALIDWTAMISLAEQQGIVEREVNEAVQFLHNLGSLQHFDNEYLKSRVVINPQWIVDVMSCIVSVHENNIKDGRFMHKDIKSVWDPKKYPCELHDWLLRLTEEFDLTFPLRDEATNLVPCLLPDRTPEFEWPSIDGKEDIRETKMLYRFDYLPAGLFNRAQVRLYQFSESSVIWKRGSLLKKNSHLALMQQTKSNEVLVNVQGPRPENILFLIHEVFEGLVTESFHGVRYDFFVPCMDCLKSGTLEPCLFAGSRVQRALQLKAPFMQCYENFHTLSITELQAMLPPDNNTDFDVHLQRTMHDLRHLRNDMSVDVFMMYCKSDVPKPGEENKKVHPSKIKEDLERAGISVVMHEASHGSNWEDIIRTLKDAQVLVPCISNNFVNDEACHQLFIYARQTLGKKLQLVLLGEGRDFMKGELGLLIAHEVFVNFQDPKRYSHKIQELVEGVNAKIGSMEKSTMIPPVFISYCWSNSHDAVKKGSKSKDGSLGWGDPRQMKDHLEQNGIRCWMDIEQTGKTGLFEDIAQGLKKAKVVVACVSDEYVQSKNCVMEFRFATVMLKVPVVMAVVGTGYKWVASEVGMLSLEFPQISFQQEDPESFTKLVEQVKSYLPDDQEKMEQQHQENAKVNRENAYKELVELVQRKFLRQLVIWSDALGMEPFPRLILVDFMEEQKPTMLPKDSIKEDVEIISAEGNSEADIKKDEEDITKENIPEDPYANLDVRNLPDFEDDKQAPSSASSRLSNRVKTKFVMKSILKTMHKSGKAEDNSSSESEDENPAPYSARSRRPKSGKGKTRPLSAHQEQSPPVLHGQRPIGFRLLCEHEEGWHSAGECLPWYQDGQNISLESWAPYLARLAVVLRDTNLNLPVLTTEHGRDFMALVENLCDDNTDFQEAYISLYNYVLETDKNFSRGNLKRCHLPSGKVVWLCPEHQQNSRLTILAHEGGTSGGVATEADRTLAEQIKEMLGETDSKNRQTRLRGQFIGARVAVETAVGYEKNFKGKKAKSGQKPPATPNSAKASTAGQRSHAGSSAQSITSSSPEQSKEEKRLAAAARAASGKSPVPGSKACSLM